MKTGNRASRLAVLISPGALKHIPECRGAWYESKEEIEEGLKRGTEKARLLRWIRREMGRHLTLRERRCVELRFFEGMSLREVGAATGTDPSSVCRAVQRSLRKLRHAAKKKRAAGSSGTLAASKRVGCPK